MKPTVSGDLKPRHINDRQPNFYHGDRFWLVRCFACDKDRGRENYASSVPSGCCAWCGWKWEGFLKPAEYMVYDNDLEKPAFTGDFHTCWEWLREKVRTSPSGTASARYSTRKIEPSFPDIDLNDPSPSDDGD